MSKRGDGSLVTVADWDGFPWLLHGFSTRVGGVSTVYAGDGAAELNLGYTREDDPKNVETNRGLAMERVAGAAEGLATVQQVHGIEVLAVDRGGAGGEADGLVTATPGLMLGVVVADCVPILIADVRRRLVGAFHAGWRGTAAGMAGAGVARMLAEGAHAEDLVAAVGPSIGPCCYHVGAEVRDRFPAGVYRGQCLDLWESNRRQLLEAGVQRISVVEDCTACSRLGDDQRRYFSHRAEGGATGRMMGLIGVAKVSRSNAPGPEKLF